MTMAISSLLTSRRKSQVRLLRTCAGLYAPCSAELYGQSCKPWLQDGVTRFHGIHVVQAASNSTFWPAVLQFCKMQDFANTSFSTLTVFLPNSMGRLALGGAYGF